MPASFIHIKKCLDVVQQSLLQLVAEGYTLPSDIVLILRLKMELNCRRLKKVTTAWFGTGVSLYWGFGYISICQWIWHRSVPSTVDQAIKQLKWDFLLSLQSLDGLTQRHLGHFEGHCAWSMKPQPGSIQKWKAIVWHTLLLYVRVSLLYGLIRKEKALKTSSRPPLLSTPQYGWWCHWKNNGNNNMQRGTDTLPF